MATSLCRMGDVIQLDDFHHNLLQTMLGEDVPEVLSLDQAKALVARVKSIDLSNSMYGSMLLNMLDNLEQLM